jgi:hypothetical protein
MLTKIKIDNMQQQQIDPMTGMPSVSISTGVQASGFQGGLPAAEDRQSTAQAMGNNFITQSQQTMGQDMFGSQSLPQKRMIGAGDMYQNPMMMTDKQEDAFGPGSEVYESGNTAIYKGLK